MERTGVVLYHGFQHGDEVASLYTGMDLPFNIFSVKMNIAISGLPHGP